MSAAIGTVSAQGNQTRTRIDEAKRQLTRVVEDIPETAIFNLIYFETRVHPFAPGSKRAGKATKAEALRSVAGLRPTGGTNIHDALELAFADKEVDTIYLLSDGAPSAGRITNPDALADEVARWNKSRRIRIHTVAIGTQSQTSQRRAGSTRREAAHNTAKVSSPRAI